MPAKLVSIVHCIVVEGLSRTAAICYIVFVADLLTFSRLDFMVVLGTPLVFCVCFFPYCQHL